MQVMKNGGGAELPMPARAKSLEEIAVMLGAGRRADVEQVPTLAVLLSVWWSRANGTDPIDRAYGAGQIAAAAQLMSRNEMHAALELSWLLQLRQVRAAG